MRVAPFMIMFAISDQYLGMIKTGNVNVPLGHHRRYTTRAHGLSSDDRLETTMATLADEIGAAVRMLGLPKTAFRLLGADGRDHVLEKVARRYVRDLNRTWWREDFRCRGLGVVFSGTATRHWLSRLMETPDTTYVWLIVGVDEPSPGLVYSGTVANVEAVLDECHGMEYYVMAHGYSWFACENHHDLCCALGFPLMRRLRRYVREHPEQIAAEYTFPRRPPVE